MPSRKALLFFYNGFSALCISGFILKHTVTILEDDTVPNILLNKCTSGWTQEAAWQRDGWINLKPSLIGSQEIKEWLQSPVTLLPFLYIFTRDHSVTTISKQTTARHLIKGQTSSDKAQIKRENSDFHTLLPINQKALAIKMLGVSKIKKKKKGGEIGVAK